MASAGAASHPIRDLHRGISLERTGSDSGDLGKVPRCSRLGAGRLPEEAYYRPNRLGATAGRERFTQRSGENGGYLFTLDVEPVCRRVPIECRIDGKPKFGCDRIRHNNLHALELL